MAKAKVYNLEGKEVGMEELNSKIFDIAPNESLIYEVVTSQMANNRQVLAHTKGRGDVRGGGKKPWKQKGTGRARHGSSRSPIWIGGGVTFGPTKDRNFSKKVNKKAKKKALFIALSDKAANEKLVLLDTFELKETKAKDLNKIKNSLPLGKTVLLVLPEKDEKILKSAKNLKGITTIAADSLNVLDILKNASLLMPLSALGKIEKTYLK